jgi:multidrug efflux pump subunit AcrA (membrane-fusion protein)
MRRTLALMLLLAAGGCKPAAPAQPIGGFNSGGKRAFPVEVRKVGTEDVQYTIDAVGTLEPQEQVKVTARVAGMVEKVLFEEGTTVTLSTVLAEIDRARYQMLADRARASHERCTAEQRKAEISSRIARS